MPVWAVTLCAIGLFALIGVGIYRLTRTPLLDWPSMREQTDEPWRAIVALEWAGLVVAVLAFSPQTNTCHLFNLLLVTTPIAVLCVAARDIGAGSRAVLIAGALIMVGCVTLPPGHFDDRTAARHVLEWKQMGGPCVGIVIGYFALLWVGLRYAMSCAPVAVRTLPPKADGYAAGRLLETGPKAEPWAFGGR
jgi:hypothetical protein